MKIIGRDGKRRGKIGVISTVPEDLLPKKALSDMGGVAGRKESIIQMKGEKGKVRRESVRRGSDLKIIPMG